MASLYAELRVGGYTYPLRLCTYGLTQSTDGRGRVNAKVRAGRVEALLDVPDNDFLTQWAATPHRPLDGCVVFYDARGGAALETVSWQAGHCVGHRQQFESSNVGAGAYVCALTIAATRLTMVAGGPPSPLVTPTPRDYAYVPPPLADFSKPLPSKPQRYDARMNLMGQAQNKLKTAPNPSAQTALTRLQRNNVAVERARLSSHVYDSDKMPPVPEPEGWHMLNAKELARRGVTPAMLTDPASGFKAALYQSTFERPPKLVIAYAGTEDGPDIKADLIQGLGLESKQHNRAMELAKQVARRTDPSKFEATGHSLGGSLAAAGSVVTGAKSYTFNAAGLHPRTVGRAPYNVASAQMEAQGRLIDAYHSAADPLTNIQMNSDPAIGSGLPRALGIPHELPPAAKWEHSWKELASRHPIDASTKMALDGHGINPQMVNHIEAEKDQDTATLTKFTAPTP